MNLIHFAGLLIVISGPIGHAWALMPEIGDHDENDDPACGVFRRRHGFSMERFPLFVLSSAIGFNGNPTP